MLVKKLRHKSNWSQEHLAMLAGVSLRTIQRVEAGNSASLETLKSLASVFEINVEKLTEEVIVIDKTTEAWKEVPYWVALGVWGIKTRKVALAFEIACVVIGLIGMIAALVEPLTVLTPLTICWGAAYWYAVSIRWIDNQQIW